MSARTSEVLPICGQAVSAVKPEEQMIPQALTLADVHEIRAGAGDHEFVWLRMMEATWQAVWLTVQLASITTLILLLLGTPLLSLLGAIGAALTLGVRAQGMLLSLLVLPLLIPVLIFGAGAVEANIAGLGVTAHFSVLGALLLLALPTAPVAAALALRIALE